jgi:hypothetical protein
MDAPGHYGANLNNGIDGDLLDKEILLRTWVEFNINGTFVRVSLFHDWGEADLIRKIYGIWIVVNSAHEISEIDW